MMDDGREKTELKGGETSTRGRDGPRGLSARWV